MSRPPCDELTPREQKVMKLLLLGLSCHEVALNLCRSVKTIQDQRRSIFQKWGVGNDVLFVHHAYEHGIIPLPKTGDSNDQSRPG